MFGQSTSSFSIPVDVVYRVRARPGGASNTLLCDVNADNSPLDRNSNSEPVVDRPGVGAGKVWQCDEGNYMFFVGSMQTMTTLDLDGDGTIEFGNQPRDVNRDGTVDSADLEHLVYAQGETVDG